MISPGRCSLFCFLLLLPVLGGCAVHLPGTVSLQKNRARELAAHAAAFNRDIRTSKGTGWLTLSTETRREKFRLAWAAKAPDRLRLTLLMSGHPVETIVASGDLTRFVSHTGRHAPHTTMSKDPDLERYIGIPVRLSEMTTLLLGQVPVRPFDQVQMVTDRCDTIVLTAYFSSTVQEIQLSHDGSPLALRRTNANGDLIFEILFQAYQKKKGHLIATGLEAKDSRGRHLSLSLPGLDPDTLIKESVFRLTPSGS